MLYSPMTAKAKVKNQKLIGESYEETFRLVVNSKKKDYFNITPGLNPYSQEGVKVISWQLIDSGIDFDVVVIPCGNESALWSIYKGFSEAKKNKLINKIPAIYGVELVNGPIGRSLETGKIEKNVSILNSSAGGIDVKESFCLQKAIKAISESEGGVETVTEEEIETAYKKLHADGLAVQFTSASVLAAAKKIEKKFPNHQICAVITAFE